MANPKRKGSKSRRDKRRTHWKITLVSASRCLQCNEVKLPHRICLHCGYYNGREILKLRT